MGKPKILIVDDEKPTRDAMARALGRSYECLTAADAELAMQAMAANPDVAVLLTDYKMPGENGIELIKKAKAAIPSLGAILITAFGEIELAVEAMKQGADDFLTKPITNIDQLEFHVAQAIRPSASHGRRASAGNPAFQNFIGSSPAMERLYSLIGKIAPSEATVLITGPSGSGKELAAHAIHALSKRADKPFVALECSAFSGDLLKSELFGYAPGTFTGGLREGKAGCFEEAAGGTIFLDEIGEIDMPTQIALLRTLETKSIRRFGEAFEKPVDFRLIAATNRNLPDMVVAGTFREDLFYRLNIIDIAMPPLANHKEDIVPLVRHFIREFSSRNGSGVTGVTPEAMNMLLSYDWPGNVRQLRNIIERMVVLASGDKLTAEDIPAEIVPPAPAAANPNPAGDSAKASAPAQLTALADAEKNQILATLEACHGNKSKAAEMLGISRRTIHRKLNEWNVA